MEKKFLQAIGNVRNVISPRIYGLIYQMDRFYAAENFLMALAEMIML